MDELIRLEEKIYAYIISTISFLKTLKNKGLSNDQTEYLALLIARLNELYGKSTDIEEYDRRVDLWRPALDIFRQIHDLYMQMHYSDFELVNEKADLQIETSIINEKLSNIINGVTNQTKN